MGRGFMILFRYVLIFEFMDINMEAFAGINFAIAVTWYF